MGPEIVHNPYHLPIVRTQLTRNIGALYPEIIDEINTALDDVLDLSGNGERLALICVCYSRMSGTFRMEDCPGVQHHAKGSLQNDQQNICRTSIV